MWLFNYMTVDVEPEEYSTVCTYAVKNGLIKRLFLFLPRGWPFTQVKMPRFSSDACDT